MSRLAACACVLLAAQAPQVSEPAVRFRAFDLFIDSGASPLAAWQVEVRFESAETKVVGVEGGEGPAHTDPAYYDAAALQGGRIVLARFTLEPSPPAGVIRVARLHVATSARAGGGLAHTLSVAAAAGPEGEPLTVQASLLPAGETR